MNNSDSPVNSMFSKISGVYDFLNHFLSLGIDKYWRTQLVKAAKPANPGIMLDMAAGTLDVAIKMAEAYPEKIIAADFCKPMLMRGVKKLKRKDLENKILPICADALKIPLPDNTAASVTIAFGIRNIPDRVGAFAEMRRVLQQGGKLAVLEFGTGKKQIWGGSYNFYLAHLLPAIGRFMGKNKMAYDYLATTIFSFPSPDILAEEMRQAGFKNIKWRKLSSGIVYLHSASK